MWISPKRELTCLSERYTKILSGVFEGRTLGTPIGLLIPNEDARSDDYSEVATKFRPSHADYTYQAKYGIRDWRGGGRTSARETAARGAAGAVARKLLAVRWNVEIVAFVSKVARLESTADLERVTRTDVDRTPIRCPDPGAAEAVIAAVDAARKDGTSLGGVVTCVVRGSPLGWGEPVFDRLEADLARGMLSLPASKGFEIGSGFAGTDLTGLEHNDTFYMEISLKASAAKGSWSEVRRSTSAPLGVVPITGGLSSGPGR